LRSATPHKFTWLLHAAEGTKPVVNGNRALIENGPAQADIVAAGENSAWEVLPTALPISAYRDFDHAKIPDRYALDLSSGDTASARFAVALKFGRRATDPAEWSLKPLPPGDTVGFISDDGEVSAVFRVQQTILRLGDLSTDGEVLAQRRAPNSTSWFAVAAQSVQENNELLLSATAPSDVVWVRGEKSIEVKVCLKSRAGIDIRTPFVSPIVSVDGSEVTPVIVQPLSGYTRLSIQNLSQGEHSVRISPRPALR
jgi:hypothetical protein